MNNILDSLRVFESEYIFINQEDTHKICKLFKDQKAQKPSFIDCSNLYFAEKLDASIASFDQWYPKERRI